VIVDAFVPVKTIATRPAPPPPPPAVPLRPPLPPSAEIEPPPAFGTHLDADYILGMAKVKDKVQILLDADRVVGKGVLETLETV